MYGYAGKMLMVDLSQEKIVEEPTSLDLVEKYLGGTGLAVHFLFQQVPPEIKAGTPENLVVLGTGPFTGTIMPCSGRLEATTLSPVTHIFADSNSGGDF